jgi:hypothetical protein
LCAGQIIAIGQGHATPEGFLGKVTSVSSSGGQTFVHTVRATLEQAISNGSFGVSLNQSPVSTYARLRHASMDTEDKTFQRKAQHRRERIGWLGDRSQG